MAMPDPRVLAEANFSVPGMEPRPLRLGQHAIVDGSSVFHRLGRELPAIGADLIEIAASVHAVDRLVRRPSNLERRGGASWARSLLLQVPVRAPELWSAHAERLATLLEWLTDDSWTLEFCSLPAGVGSLDQSQGFLFDTVPSGSVPMLFSGGIDSTAGLAAELTHADAVAISVDTNNWMQHVQQRVLRELAKVSQHACTPLRYRVSLRAQGVESSQRSRGLLFLAAGIATAWGLGQNRLRVFENGIGAINLPYLRSQFGSQATRSMHPRTLRLAEALATAVSEQPFHIQAPALTATKAEVIRSWPRDADRALALTVSCDTGFAARVTNHAPCGACTSCLLRRQALHAAGRACYDEDSVYHYRKGSSPAEMLQVMLWQVSRLRTCLAQPDPWLALVSEFPEVLDTEPLSPVEVIAVYRTYVQEWEGLEADFPAGSQASLRTRTVA
jgi:7-cyano-7-deazaguanine synthase in queuosine biosynthesis